MKYLMLYLCIFSIFAFLGAVSLGTIGHEIYHRWDFRDIAKEKGTICLIEYHTLNAQYSMNVAKGKLDDFENKKINSEIFAYSISMFFALIFVFSFYKLFCFILNSGDIDENLK